MSKMRGSALIVHSIDPETLDRMDDLESLDPESEDENDRYKEIDELKLNSHPHHISDERVTDLSYDSSYSSNASYSSRHNYENSSKINVGQPIVKSTTILHTPFNPLSSPLSSSPPLIKSHYDDSHKENYYSSHTSLNSQSQKEINRVVHNPSSHHDFSDQVGKTFTSGSGMPLSRVKTSRNEILSTNNNKNSNQDDGSSNNRGFARFLFFQKPKENPSKINVNNLPPHLREELRHIYVY